MNQQDTQPLSVKAFIEKRADNKINIDVIVTPAGSVEEAEQMFDAYYRDEACQATYIYRGDRIIRSWDRHAHYLTAIQDIDDSEEYAWHHFLTDEEREQLKPWEQFVVEEEQP